MQAAREHRRSQDISGYAVFAGGDSGAIHLMAHDMLDRGLFEQGQRRLGAWLRGRTGEGSEWVHLQWHMAVFELALGYWDEAHARFLEHVLPAATNTEDALTDAPAMLWRLSLAAPRSVELAWEPARATAVRSLQHPTDPYVEIHGLLALAGARDLESLERWLASRETRSRSLVDRLVTRTGEGLLAYASGDYRLASSALGEVAPNISMIGGSRAQNELFVQIARTAGRLATADESLSRVA